MNISICMAVYNGQDYLEEQLISIVRQMGIFDELIIVDDCSTDKSLEVIRGIVQDDKRVKVYENEKNMGVVSTFERALNYSSGEIIFFSDQDDIWAENKVNIIRGKFKENLQLKCIVTNAFICDARSKKNGRCFFSDDYKPKFSLLSQFIKNDFLGCSMAFHRDVIDHAIPFPKNISMHDWWVGCVSLMRGEVIYIKEPLIIYRRHNRNLSPSKRRSILNVIRCRFWNFFAIVNFILRKRHG